VRKLTSDNFERIRIVSLAVLAIALTGCSSPVYKNESQGKSSSGYYQNDRPVSGVTQAQIDSIKEPEPIRLTLSKGAMRPYVALGQTFTPMTTLSPFTARGVASWYGTKYSGLKTSSGEVYDPLKLTGAHPTLPLPCFVRVTNLENGKSIVIKLNDRGPFLRGRLIDVSYAAARRLGFADKGSANVEVTLIIP
jgi:rare lipoprotein A